MKTPELNEEDPPYRGSNAVAYAILAGAGLIAFGVGVWLFNWF